MEIRSRRGKPIVGSTSKSYILGYRGRAPISKRNSLRRPEKRRQEMKILLISKARLFADILDIWLRTSWPTCEVKRVTAVPASTHRK
jgi:hypothetical protein